MAATTTAQSALATATTGTTTAMTGLATGGVTPLTAAMSSLTTGAVSPFGLGLSSVTNLFPSLTAVMGLLERSAQSAASALAAVSGGSDTGTSGLAGVISSFFGGGSTGSSAGFGLENVPYIPFAKGAAFTDTTSRPEQPQVYAEGGTFQDRKMTNQVFENPRFFDFGKGKKGVLGEFGPEAVMPLERTEGSSYGVNALINGKKQVLKTGRMPSGELGIIDMFAEGGEFGTGTVPPQQAPADPTPDPSLMAQPGQQKADSGVKLTVNVFSSGEKQNVRTEQRDDGEGGFEVDVFLDQLEAKLSKDIRAGNGLAPVLEAQYGLSRSNGSMR